jgi:hypothetical protein
MKTESAARDAGCSRLVGALIQAGSITEGGNHISNARFEEENERFREEKQRARGSVSEREGVGE